MQMVSDRNLLFGILALQMDFIDQQQLVSGLQSWVNAKQKPLSQILIENGAMADAKRQLLEPLLDAFIREHDGDAQQSLAALTSIDGIQKTMQSLEISTQVETDQALESPEDSDEFAAKASEFKINSMTSRFRALRFHAAGGLGTVFVAKDIELNREVALKEIKPKFVNQSGTRARFLMEAEITGSLEHPGIVPVYGLGAYPDGRPYYTMRFIRGESFKEAISNFRECKFESESDKNLAFRDLLKRFVDVCNAIAFAHSRGILHRDIKPANIMLGKYGETLVVDWGMAKAIGAHRDPNDTTDEEPFRPAIGSSANQTVMGSVLGTLCYMSPEQASGKTEAVGTPADIFSLGATLYSVLTGLPPYRAREHSHLLTQAKSASFAKPRELDRQIPIALESICLKAMAKSPTDRYPSASSLAQDIDRFLADEAVTAYREPRIQRVQRMARRHPAFVSGLVATMLVGLSSLGVGLYMVNSERKRTEFARLDAERQRLVAVEAEGKSQRAAIMANEQKEKAIQKATEAEAASGFMTEVFGAADPLGLAGDQITPASSGSIVTATDLLDRGVSKVNSQFSERPLIRARMLEAFGSAYCGLGQYEHAETLLKESLRLREASNANEEDLASSLHHSSILMLHIGRFTESQSMLRRALTLRQKVFNDDDPRTLETALLYAWSLSGNMSASSVSNETQQEVIEMLKDIVDKQSKRQSSSQRDIAIAQLALAAAQLTKDSKSDEAKSTLMKLLNSQSGSFKLIVADFLLAEQMRRFGQLELAEKSFDRIEVKLGELVGINHPYKMAFDASHANLLKQLNRLDEAENKILSVFERVSKTPLRWHPLVARALIDAGNHFRDTKKFDKAKQLYQEAQSVAEKIGRSDLQGEAEKLLSELAQSS